MPCRNAANRPGRGARLGMGVGCLDEVDIGAILPRTAGTYGRVLRPAVGKPLAADDEPKAGVKPRGAGGPLARLSSSVGADGSCAWG